MTINLTQFLKFDLYLALMVLVIVLIVLLVKIIKTLNKVDNTLDKINDKIDQMDGVFNLVEKTGSFADEISNKIIMVITNLIGRFINRKKGNDYDE